MRGGIVVLAAEFAAISALKRAARIATAILALAATTACTSTGGGSSGSPLPTARAQIERGDPDAALATLSGPLKT